MIILPHMHSCIAHLATAVASATRYGRKLVTIIPETYGALCWCGEPAEYIFRYDTLRERAMITAWASFESQWREKD